LISFKSLHFNNYNHRSIWVERTTNKLFQWEYHFGV